MSGKSGEGVFEGYCEAAVREILGGYDASAPVLVVAAHMDDEAIGVGALLGRLKNAGFLYVTDGAARNGRAARARGFSTRLGYAAARMAEARRALNLMPCAPAFMATLDVPDLEASYGLVRTTLAVKDAVEMVRPCAVFTHPYEGGHPDHDSAAFVVWAALSLMRMEGKGAPRAVEFTSYHGAGKKMVTSAFLQPGQAEVSVSLTEKERALKQEMFSCFETQKGALRLFPVAVERFRRAPAYDFTKPAHEGRLFYQHFDWGLPGRMWPGKAARAMRELGLGEARAKRSLREATPAAIVRYMRYLRSRTAL